MNKENVKIRCKQCEGHYVLRDGKYGAFGGCSNFPKCKSTMRLSEFVTEFFNQKGVNIYKWDKECWKCKQKTPVYSYYLNYQLAELDEAFSSVGMLGIGEVGSIDEVLAKEIPTIKMSYSRTLKCNYMANTCIYCGALQGSNYVVEDPHEIMQELFYGGMEKYLVKTLKVEDMPELPGEIKRIFH